MGFVPFCGVAERVEESIDVRRSLVGNAIGMATQFQRYGTFHGIEQRRIDHIGRDGIARNVNIFGLRKPGHCQDRN